MQRMVRELCCRKSQNRSLHARQNRWPSWAVGQWIWGGEVGEPFVRDEVYSTDRPDGSLGWRVVEVNTSSS